MKKGVRAREKIPPSRGWISKGREASQTRRTGELAGKEGTEAARETRRKEHLSLSGGKKALLFGQKKKGAKEVEKKAPQIRPLNSSRACLGEGLALERKEEKGSSFRKKKTRDDVQKKKGRFLVTTRKMARSGVKENEKRRHDAKKKNTAASGKYSWKKRWAPGKHCFEGDPRSTAGLT